MDVVAQLHAHAALPLAKSKRYQLDRRLSAARNVTGRYGEEKLTSAGNRTPALDPIAIKADLFKQFIHFEALCCKSQFRTK
jgi:hypothetical protein